MFVYDGIPLRLATNADIPRLPDLLTEYPEFVRVRDMWRSDMASFPLADIVTGPFAVLEEDGHFVIYGTDRRTGLRGRARIDDGVLQYINERYLEWGQSPIGPRLFVP